MTDWRWWPWLLLGLLLGLLLSLVLTGLVRRYALARRQWLDLPNARSSHAQATPRGGGLAMVLGFVLILPLAILLQRGPSDLLWALLPALLLVAAVGLRDDRRHVPAPVRILVHALALVWALYWLGGGLQLWLSGPPGVSGWPVQLFALLALLWFLNLFNFMDGIDGIAAVEAVFLGAAGAWLAAAAGQPQIAFALGLLAALALGFLRWNWPPARIFMGDVGSGFLGAALGLLGYASVLAAPTLLWPWLILVALFVSDATLTLLHRWWRGERWYQAHRSHAYQHAARRFGHRRVTLGLLLIDLAWLLPLALLAAAFPQRGALLALLAYLPLLVLAWRLGAGRPAA